jgi:hypothetical protein
MKLLDFYETVAATWDEFDDVQPGCRAKLVDLSTCGAARPGSALAPYGDDVAPVARDGSGGDLSQRGSEFDCHVDRRTSQAFKQPRRALCGIASVFVDQATPVRGLDPAAAISYRFIDDGQHKAQFGARGLAELGRLAQQPRVVTRPEVVHGDVPRAHGRLSLLARAWRDRR